LTEPVNHDTAFRFFRHDNRDLAAMSGNEMIVYQAIKKTAHNQGAICNQQIHLSDLLSTRGDQPGEETEHGA
jgi:hypothetical protein